MVAHLLAIFGAFVGNLIFIYRCFNHFLNFIWNRISLAFLGNLSFIYQVLNINFDWSEVFVIRSWNFVFIEDWTALREEAVFRKQTILILYIEFRSKILNFDFSLMEAHRFVLRFFICIIWKPILRLIFRIRWGLQILIKLRRRLILCTVCSAAGWIVDELVSGTLNDKTALAIAKS